MFYHRIPLINLGVSTSAFLFQIFVVNPRHNQLISQLNRIEMDIYLIKEEKQNRK